MCVLLVLRKCVPVFIELETIEHSIRLKGLRRYVTAWPEVRNDRTVNGEDFRDPLFVRTSNIATAYQFSLLRTIRSGVIGPYETILADVVAFKLGELRLLQPEDYRSITAHADGVECPLGIRPMVERRLGGHVVGQSGPFREPV